MNSPLTSDSVSSSPLFRGWRFWLGLSLVWGALGLLSAAQTAVLGNMEWNTAWYRAFLDWGPWVVLAPLVWGLADRVPVARSTWRRAVPVHLAAAVALSAGLELLSWFVPDGGPAGHVSPGAARFSEQPGPGRPGGPPAPPGFQDGFDPGPPPGFSDNRETRGTALPPVAAPSPPRGTGGGRARLAIPIYFLLVAAAHAVAYHERSLERERRIRAAETSLAKARLGALQTQLQPHFFFNALNAVASLIPTRPDLADKMICSLADLMRAVLDVSDQPEVPLRRELAFIDHYLAVQTLRFGDRLVVVRDIDEAAHDCLVPPLLLQPLVENAVVHGVEPRRLPSTVTLRARRSFSGRLRLSVANPCAEGDPASAVRVGEPVVFASRVGLSNTRARLAALHGADHHFEIRRTADGVVAEIELPARTSPV